MPSTKMPTSDELQMIRSSALGMVEFIEQSPSPFHAVTAGIDMLEKSGYTRIKETDDPAWKALKPGDKRYFTRNQSTLGCFAIGGNWKPGNGFTVLAAHTDSPVLRLKPKSRKGCKEGFHQLGVQTYGGGLWHTWFDRDLSVAGRVMVETDKGFETRLVRINRPICRVPTLAIHLETAAERKAFEVNKETHLAPILCTEVARKLGATGGSGAEEKDEGDHPMVLLQILAKELNIEPAAIKDFELSLYDTNAPTLGGAFEEFVFAPRLDNLASTFCGLTALTSADGLEKDENTRIGFFFDNEEIGSKSNRGAASTLLSTTMQRITGGVDLLPISLPKSFLVSMDMAHGVHPNYSSKHESCHRPKMHEGLVVKYNVNERYATTLESAFPLFEIARKNDMNLQRFVVRQDSGCGSTIGPMSSVIGIRTVDVGIAQLSMHSIREVCGTHDILSTIDLMKALLQDFAAFDKTVQTGE